MHADTDSARSHCPFPSAGEGTIACLHESKKDPQGCILNSMLPLRAGGKNNYFPSNSFLLLRSFTILDMVEKHASAENR